MNDKRVKPRWRPVGDLPLDTSGAALIELALVMPILAFMLVLATDYGLERIAEAQIQAALIAAGEYATVRGCSIADMKSAAESAVQGDVLTFDVSNAPFCGCMAHDDRVPHTTDGVPPACSTNTKCVYTETTPAIYTHPGLYARITVTGNYHYLLGLYTRTISQTMLVRSFDVGKSCQ